MLVVFDSDRSYMLLIGNAIANFAARVEWTLFDILMKFWLMNLIFLRWK